ncbi:MAG: PAS domain S-box protein [Methanobacteriaceae archaeon]|nr:PAS domain S-box protein [Methanobacteriaceae archaeon]
MDDENIEKDILRKKAEKLLQDRFSSRDDISQNDQYIHELHVHQIELEIQNEELREAQIKLEESRREYFDLYNFAPVGYFTLDKEGIILKANLAGSELLGVERLNLHKSAFIQYIKTDQRNKFHQHLKKVLKTGNKNTVNLKLIRMSNNSFYAHFETIKVLHDNGNFKEFRITVTDITKLKNTERNLKDSEERYHQIFYNNHTSMILIDPNNGDIIDANPAATKFYGYNLDELVKMKISDINVSDKDLIVEEMQKAVSGQKNHFMFKHRLSDGKIRDVEVYSGLIKQKGNEFIYSIVHDITLQKNAEIERRKTEQLFRLIFDQSPLGSIIVSLDHIPLKVNDAISRMLGYSKEELLSMRLHEYDHPDDLDEELKKQKLLILGIIDNFILEKRFINKNGEILWGNLYVSSIKDKNDKLIGLLRMIENTTISKQMEELVNNHTANLERINRKLNVEIGDNEKAEIKLDQLIKKLQYSNKELEQFAYVSSHDLKEPLRMITSFLQLLQKRYSADLDKDANDFINYAVDGAKRMDMAINDILEYSRIGSQKREFNYLKSEKILEIVLINLKPLIKDTNTIITHDPLPSIYANHQQMNQLFQNIIENAIKYRSKVNPKIHVSADKHDKEYVFSIKDNGIGIDSKHLERIFNMFQRLHSREEYEGTGIGLAISQKIVHHHDGKIWAKSELGKGTTIYFTIPNEILN